MRTPSSRRAFIPPVVGEYSKLASVEEWHLQLERILRNALLLAVTVVVVYGSESERTDFIRNVTKAVQ
jgi:hypothetical protein